MSETYQFRYQGAEFHANLDIDTAVTTTALPNIRVMSGAWKTFHLDPGEHPTWQTRLLKSVNPNNPALEHPAGNLSMAASNSEGGMLMINPNTGYLQRAPIGYAVVWRMHNT